MTLQGEGRVAGFEGELGGAVLDAKKESTPRAQAKDPTGIPGTKIGEKSLGETIFWVEQTGGIEHPLGCHKAPPRVP